jgi:hypothetical protein
VWTSYFHRPLYSPLNPDGVYVVRDGRKNIMGFVQLHKRNWSTKVAFDDYALVCPLEPGWKLQQD